MYNENSTKDSVMEITERVTGKVNNIEMEEGKV